MKQLFLDNWLFSEQPLQDSFDLAKIDFKESQFNNIEMPHDWLINDVNDLYRPSEGWYFKEFLIENSKDHDFYLEFDGIYMDSEIYLNGSQIIQWKYGYTPIMIPVTEMKTGINQLFVRVKHQPPNSRWYSGAGIYRNVWLHQVGKCHIHPNETYLHHEKVAGSSDEWNLYVSQILVNTTENPQTVVLSWTLEGPDGHLTKQKESLLLQPGTQKWQKTLKVTQPLLWSPENPVLYTLQTTLTFADELATQDHRVGFREVVLDKNKGLLLNGKHLKIQGVCQHHDLGALGAVANKAAIKRQLEILKKMGVNAIRTAHNPFSKEFYELTDELGFLVQSEFVDIWKHPKNANDYSRFFSDWVHKDVAAWIKRDRNFSSVFMWSIGNEIYDTHGREDGVETTQRLIDEVKKHDPLHNAFISFGSNYLLWDNTQKAADLLEAVGYNYAESIYKEHHEKHPRWVIYGSETGSVVQSRGVYHFPLKLSTLADDDYQCSALGNSRTSWGAESVEKCIVVDRDIPYSLGQFVWSGFDYIGEPTPYNTKNSYLGQIDTAGFPKDAYYTFQAAWTDYKQAPMIHLFPYWDFTEGQLIDVRICSNAPLIELFFNGESLGKVENNPKIMDKILHDWQIAYVPGKLEAVAYDESGAVIARDVQTSFGEMTQIRQQVNKNQVSANGTDICFIEIDGLDSQGNQVKNANNEIFVEVKGPGRIIGIDNGDSTDFSQYKSNHKRLFNGKLLLMVGSTDQPGEIEVICRSRGLAVNRTTILSVSSKEMPGSNRHFELVSYEEVTEVIPVRKILLNYIKNESGEFVVTATCLPENAQKQELYWRVTDEKGIDSDLGQWHFERNQLTIVPVANGEVNIRCGVKNGKSHLDLYVSLPLVFSGLKESKLDPYKPISGGRYSRSNVQLTNGNERGVATLRDGESWVTFDEVDFGTQGADYLTLSLFPLENNPFKIEVYEGQPQGEGGRFITELTYDRGSVWNTYQEQSYQLPEILKGTRTITFVFRQKVHLKEFYFTKLTHGFEKISVLANDGIYGDSFTISAKSIDQIGNNVTLSFDNFDFGETGATGIEIFGRTPEASNSIQIKIKTEQLEERYLMDISYKNEFSLEKLFFGKTLKGKCDIEFIFLPGSNFDFEWLRFLSKKMN